MVSIQIVTLRSPDIADVRDPLVAEAIVSFAVSGRAKQSSTTAGEAGVGTRIGVSVTRLPTDLGRASPLGGVASLLRCGLSRAAWCRRPTAACKVGQSRKWRSTLLLLVLLPPGVNTSLTADDVTTPCDPPTIRRHVTADHNSAVVGEDPRSLSLTDDNAYLLGKS